jgi:CDP-diacylglycerol--glycerol-3-phosphate 3-phosphatidyltransferase
MDDRPPADKLELGKITNLPNLLSISRLFLLPIILFLLAAEKYQGALAMLCVSWLTDALDGTIARRTGQVTNLGKILDHFVDKISVGTILVILVLTKKLPFWIAAIVIIRDTLIVIGSIILIKKKRFLYSSSSIGKIAGFFFALLMVIYILEIKSNFIKSFINGIVGVLVGVSFTYYTYQFIKTFTQRS